jgi:Ca2+-binding EF-hand superfamily protein
MAGIFVCEHQLDLSIDDNRKLLLALDANNDGNISYAEFVKFLQRDTVTQGQTAAAPKALLSVSDRVATELRTKFDAAIDSGKIRSYEDVFRAMDKDGDGTVSKAEFEDGLRDLRVCCWSGVMVCLQFVDAAVPSGCML